MIKKLLKIVLILIGITLVFASIFFYSIFISVERLVVQYQEYESSQIPVSFDNVTIAFFSDIEYNYFMKKDRFQKMISKIKENHPDIILFGGDLIFHPNKTNPNDQIKQELIELLKQLQAPLGKFAVLGEQDYENEDHLIMIKDILYQSDFEVLENENRPLYNEKLEAIQLLGFDSYLNEQFQFQDVMENVDENSFTIAFTHAPDSYTISDFPIKKIDLAFAGHTHANQLSLPFFGPLKKIDGAKTYSHGTYQIEQTILHLNNGLGTSSIDMRLFAPPQVTIYRLQHIPPQQETQPSQEPSS